VNDELRAHPDKPYGDGITAILQVWLEWKRRVKGWAGGEDKR